MLPPLFLSRLEKIYPDKYDQILESYANKRVGSFRINTLKPTENLIAELEKIGISVSPFSHIPNTYCCNRTDEYALKGTDFFYNGNIYLQSLASMLPVLVLKPLENEKILDVCAAPGSKTTQIAADTNNTASITALEKNKIRCDKLEYNIKLQGAKNITTKKIDALKFLAQQNCPMFDKILLDVPCSSEGRFDANREKSYKFWNMDIVRRNAELQYSLLSSSLKKLKPGGTLVYSTCTISPEENEMVIQNILDTDPNISLCETELFLSEYFQTGMTHWEEHTFSEEMQQCIRVLPSDHTEGFFIAKLKKD